MSDAPVPPRPARELGDLAALAGAARLPLDDAEREAVGATLTTVYGVLDVLDHVDLDAVAPATPVDPRWE